MRERGQVVVVGAGQAGLAVSHELSSLGVDHVVLDSGRPGDSWRGRWDSFRLNTPAWTVALPGRPHGHPDPAAFLSREEIVDYLERYAMEVALPIRPGVRVTALEPEGGSFHLQTDAGDLLASQVVIASGAYQRQHRPVPAEAFPARLLAIDAAEYRNPAALPLGAVLVVGSGQTGCQVAEDLVRAGREVAIACGRAPWSPRRLDGVDIVDWLARTPWFDMPLPSPAARLGANVLTSGTEGGHDLNYRTLQAEGAVLGGHLVAVDGDRAVLADDLAETVAFSDQRYADMCAFLRQELPRAGYEVPAMPVPEPFTTAAPLELDLGGFGTVIFAAGYRPDYSWVRVPGAFDPLGFPITRDGSSQAHPGLHFMGVHFLRKRKSSLLFGVSEDAAIVARSIAERNQGAVHHPAG